MAPDGPPFPDLTFAVKNTVHRGHGGDVVALVQQRRVDLRRARVNEAHGAQDRVHSFPLGLAQRAWATGPVGGRLG